MEGEDHMKFKRFFVALLAMTVLPLSACKQEDPGVEVEKINVSKVEDYFVVGQEFNLDNYVSVVGGKGPSSYTVKPAEGYENMVDFGEGKKAHFVTVLQEGNFQLDLHASNLDTEASAVFRGSGISKLKSEFKDDTKIVTKNYGFDRIQFGEAGSETTVEYIRHNSNYFYDLVLGQDGNWSSKGLIKYKNSGISYEFSANGLDCDNFQVGNRDDKFDMYFCNSPWLLTADDAVTSIDDYGEDYLLIDCSKPAQHGAYWDSLTAEFVSCAFNIDFTADAIFNNYKLLGLYIYGEENDKGKITSYRFDVMLVDKATETDLKIYSQYRFVAPVQARIALLEDEYVKGTHEPLVNYDELKTVWTTFYEAETYSARVEQYWVDSNDNPIDIAEYAALTPDDLKLAQIAELFPCDAEAVVNDKKVGRISKQLDWRTGSETGYVKGYAEKDEEFFEFESEQDGEGVWGQPKAYPNPKSKLVNRNEIYNFSSYKTEKIFTDFYPYSREQNGNKITWTYGNDVDNILWIDPLFLQSLFHSSQNVSYFRKKNADGYYYRYLSGTVGVDTVNTEISFEGKWGFAEYENIRMVYKISISKPNTTVVDLTTIDFGG